MHMYFHVVDTVSDLTNQNEGWLYYCSLSHTYRSDMESSLCDELEGIERELVMVRQQLDDLLQVHTSFCIHSLRTTWRLMCSSGHGSLPPPPPPQRIYAI